VAKRLRFIQQNSDVLCARAGGPSERARTPSRRRCNCRYSDPTKTTIRSRPCRPPRHLAPECWSRTTPDPQGFGRWLATPRSALSSRPRGTTQSTRVSREIESSLCCSLCLLPHVAKTSTRRNGTLLPCAARVALSSRFTTSKSAERVGRPRDAPRRIERPATGEPSQQRTEPFSAYAVGAMGGGTVQVVAKQKGKGYAASSSCICPTCRFHQRAGGHTTRVLLQHSAPFDAR